MGGTGGLAVPIRKFDNLEALLTGVQHVHPSPDSSAPFPLSPPGPPDPALLSGPMRLLVHITPSTQLNSQALMQHVLRAAVEARDAKFMVAPVVEAYTGHRAGHGVRDGDGQGQHTCAVYPRPLVWLRRALQPGPLQPAVRISGVHHAPVALPRVVLTGEPLHGGQTVSPPCAVLTGLHGAHTHCLRQ